MRLLVSEDTTTPSYWLNWRFLLCAIWVLTSMLFASFLIWKYERSDNSKSERGETQQERPRILCYDESWKPCVKEIHPLSLVVFRLIAFCLLLVSLSFDVAAHGGELFYYYTQWTFTLITIYFGFGFLLSVNGCLQHHRPNSSNDYYVSEVAEQGLYEPLAHGVNENGVKLRKQLECPEEHHCSRTAGLCGYLFQILFQISAGAVTLTDGLYWTIIFPFLTIRDYELSFSPILALYSHGCQGCYSSCSHNAFHSKHWCSSFHVFLFLLLLIVLVTKLRNMSPCFGQLTVVAHSLNAILLLGDTALNSMGFPWYRISFFILWTATYVIFQWIIHAFVSIWWPYPILDLSFDHAPLWYLVVALLHIPCYGIFVLLVKIKHLVLSKRFPQSYQFCP